MDVYVGAKKSTLVSVLELALDQVRESAEGHVSVTIHATASQHRAGGGDAVVIFSDEDTDGDEDGRVTIELEG